MEVKVYIFGAFVLFSALAVFAGDLPSVTISNGHAYVTTPRGRKEGIVATNDGADAKAKLIDLTFNGYADLLILRDRGASQEFYDVYLYSKAKDTFIYNKRLSEIPCLSVDVSRKELVGQCFHQSACENWEEYYSVSQKGNISLVERRGTYCDPTGGKAYTYIDRFRNGKKIFSKTSPETN